MKKIDSYKELLDKVEKVTAQKQLDLSSGEDLSVGIMNLIAMEEHLFFTFEKTGRKMYLNLLNEIRLMRTELMKNIIKDYEGEVWCISKHLLSASMRLIEVGTKELRKGKKKEAQELFHKAYKLYSLFWGINLKAISIPNDKLQMTNDKVEFRNEKGKKKGTASVFDKLGTIVQKVLDCCKE